jgi:hypothetical protein
VVDGDSPSSKSNTTLRLDPEVRQFVDEQAAHYGISAQAFISMMLRGLMLSSGPAAVEQTSLLESRFYELFEAHGQAPVAITNMLREPFGITLATLKRPDLLLEHITPELIGFLSQRFGVQKEWLQGESDRIYAVESFDKRLYGLGLLLHELHQNGGRARVHFVMEDSYDGIDPESEESSGWSDCKAYAGFLLEVEQDGYHSYKVLKAQPWGYNRTRHEMQAFLGFLNACRDILWLPDGYEAWFLDSSRFHRLFNGELWPQSVIGTSAPAQAELSRQTGELYDLAWPFTCAAEEKGDGSVDGSVMGERKLARMLKCIKEEPRLTVRELDVKVREASSA